MKKGVYTRKIKPGKLVIWALGQSGFIFKDSSDIVIAIDPCLADPVAKRVNPKWKRLYPPPVKPKELSCHILAVTHNHLDHLDPDTISALPKGAVKYFVGPGNACREFRKLGIAKRQIIQLDASESIKLCGVRLTGTMAISNDASQPDAEGFLIEFKDAPSVYHTGDTSFHPLLANVAKRRPYVYMPCINGKYGNMDSFEAAVLGASLRAKWAIPHHYDMFRENLAAPLEFKANMAQSAPETKCVVLNAGEKHIFKMEEK